MVRLFARGSAISSAAWGHAYTILPYLERQWSPPQSCKTDTFRTTVVDPNFGPLELTGALLPGPHERLTVVLHGLGGNIESGYMRAALAASRALGLKVLLLNQRGADRRGHDFAHAGLVEDLASVLRAPEFASAREITILGFSLGGHTALRYACLQPDARVRSVAAVCAPLDLREASDAFDRPRFSVYRRHVMESLHQIYTASYQRFPRGIEPYEARQISLIREWDERIVAPRFGFGSALEYYQKMSVAPLLPELRLDSLYLGALHDPMVPKASVEPGLLRAAHLSEVWAQRAGHLGFSPGLDLGFADAPRGLFGQVLAWLWSDPAARRATGLGSDPRPGIVWGGSS